MAKFNLKWFLFAIAIVSFVGGLWLALDRNGKHTNSEAHAEHTHSSEKQKYFCPMHPSVISDEPGICPICHMDLQPMEEDEVEELAETGEERKILFYRHPMQPDITSEVPAKDQMGMDYIPVYADELAEASSESKVPGRSGFSLSPHRQQMIGVTHTIVEKRPLTKEIRATGRVAFDPELFTAIEEYRQALLGRSQMGGAAYPGLKAQVNALLASSRTKLKLLGLTDEQIRKLGSQRDAMDLLLPKGKAWVYAEIFEYEMGSVEPSQKIKATAPSIPGEVFEGEIASISPVLDAPTRTVRVRAQVPDPKGLLRPDTFLNVRVISDLGDRLAIPEDSVMHTGQQAYVFVFDEKGRYEPKPVVLGQKAGDHYEVLEGLEAGQKVVTGANFLIDSESRLRAVAIEKASSADTAAQSKESVEQ